MATTKVRAREGKKPLLQEVLLELLAERSVQVLLSLIHRARIWE